MAELIGIFGPGATPLDVGTVKRPGVLIDGTNFSAVPQDVLEFSDPAADERWAFDFRVPADYASGGSLKWEYAQPSGSGDVSWISSYAAIASGESLNASFGSDVTSAAAAGTAPNLTTVSHALGITLAAGDLVKVRWGRRLTGDTLAASVAVLIASIRFEYTSS